MPKIYPVELSEQLSKLFNCSSNQAKFPNIRTESNVTPDIYKR